jgi:hypothetical protein
VETFDQEAREAFKNGKKNALSWFLIASYCYYCRYESILSDEVYDKMALYLLNNYDEIDHMHKHLVTKDMLQAGTAYNLRMEDYPLRVRVIGEDLMDRLNRGRDG